jgi:hypothetical protein
LPQNCKTRIAAIDLTRTGLFVEIRTASLTQPGAILPAQRLHRKGHDHLIPYQWIQINPVPIMAIDIEIVSFDGGIRIARETMRAQGQKNPSNLGIKLVSNDF